MPGCEVVAARGSACFCSVDDSGRGRMSIEAALTPQECEFLLLPNVTSVAIGHARERR
jgi:hypothetical protein